MEATIDRLKSELSTLPPADRVDLAHFLIESLGEDESIADDPAWEAEILRRVEEAGRFEFSCKPAERVFAEIRGKYA
jgi:hypothetical protein